MDCALNQRQTEALQKRFGDVLDLRKEFVAARDYALHIHTGRPYKNFGRFFWNWCRAAEERALARAERGGVRRRAEAEAREGRDARAAIDGQAAEFTREQLEEMLRSEIPALRDLAREELKLL